MLEVLISIPTILVCTLLAALVAAVFLTQHWWTARSAGGPGYWCVSSWLGASACVLLALRGTLAPELSIGLGNALVCLGYGFCWAGFRAFDDHRVSVATVAAGPLIWCAAYLLWNAFAADMNLRIILLALIVPAYSLAIAHALWRGWKKEALPSRRFVATLFAVHAVVYLLRIPFAVFAPVPVGSATHVAPWFPFFALEIFVHTMVGGVAILVLIKERSEFVFRHAARCDALTGLLNRGAFMDEVADHLSRRPQKGVLMLLDLDHFKGVNDTHGHLAGDKVLRRFASAVAAKLDGPMVFGRFGGEEFALFAPQLELDRAVLFANALKDDVAALSVGHYNALISVTTSIGLAPAGLFVGNLDDLVAAADFALYRAKEEGRNRVCVAGPTETLIRMANTMRGGGTSAVLTASAAG